MDDKKYNIVKVRDDKTPIKYLPSSETHDFELVDQEKLDWCNG